MQDDLGSRGVCPIPSLEHGACGTGGGVGQPGEAALRPEGRHVAERDTNEKRQGSGTKSPTWPYRNIKQQAPAPCVSQMGYHLYAGCTVHRRTSAGFSSSATPHTVKVVSGGATSGSGITASRVLLHAPALTRPAPPMAGRAPNTPECYCLKT